MDDKFIKEKLDLVVKDDELIEEPVPDSLKALNKQYAQIFAERQNKKQTTRRRYLIPVFSSVAAAVLVCVALLCFSFFHKPEEDTRYYTEYNYAKEQIAYEQITAEHDILLYNAEHRVLSSYVMKNVTLNNIASIIITYQLSDGELQLTALIDPDYKYSEADSYSSLPNSASNDLFEFKYLIFPEDNTALAMCEYNNRTYYFRYSSPYPEDITIIMNDMKA